jgi:hypothetical protein
MIGAQNPQIAPATNTPQHAARVQEVKQWAMKNNLGIYDVFRSFSRDPRSLAALIDTGAGLGVHPIVPDGYAVQAAARTSPWSARLHR